MRGGGQRPLGDSRILQGSQRIEIEETRRDKTISLEKVVGGRSNFPFPSPMRKDSRTLLGDADVYSFKFGGHRRQVFGPPLRNVRRKTTWGCLLGGRAEIWVYSEPAVFLTTRQSFMFLWTKHGPFSWELAKGCF